MTDNNLLSYSEFESVMNDIQKTYEYSINWNYFMHENIPGQPILFQPDCLETSILLLEKMFYDDQHLIRFFCEGLHFGKAADYRSARLKLYSVSDLYDLLMENIARHSVSADPISPDGTDISDESGGDA